MPDTFLYEFNRVEYFSEMKGGESREGKLICGDEAEFFKSKLFIKS